MKANLHTHTFRCGHAVGTEEEYVRTAIAEGMEVLGFSDHSPHPFRNGYESRVRMKLDQLEDYVNTVLTLRKKYAGQIRIPLGLELEYFPGMYPELMEILKDYPFDYLLLAQHFLEDMRGRQFMGVMNGDDELLDAYCRRTMDAMNLGVFTYFAHPDYINYSGDPAYYRKTIRQLCREANSCAIPLEINLLGVREGRHYPNPAFWEIAAEEGCTAVLGWDAHSPRHLHCPEAEDSARRMAERLGMKVVDGVPLRPVR